jgi:divalent metal cation (Fe/Co/Zn/Cd) transporter
MLSQVTGYAAWDGIAAVVIGLILAGTAIFLATETKALLVGEGADPETVRRIREIAMAHPHVEAVRRPLTMYFGPSSALLAMDLEMRRGLNTTQVVTTIDELEQEIRREFTDIKHIYLEADAIKKSVTGEPLG